MKTRTVCLVRLVLSIEKKKKKKGRKRNVQIAASRNIYNRSAISNSAANESCSLQPRIQILFTKSGKGEGRKKEQKVPTGLIRKPR